jgi:hypothetical protein
MQEPSPRGGESLMVLQVWFDWASITFRAVGVWEDDDANDCTTIYHEDHHDFGLMNDGSVQEIAKAINNSDLEWYLAVINRCLSPSDPLTAGEMDGIITQLVMKLVVIPSFENPEETWLDQYFPEFAAEQYDKINLARRKIVEKIMES